MTQFGGSWWGQRWIEALERLSTAWQNRLPRGRDYAAKGHVISLRVTGGKISARVQGSRSKPYQTTIEIPALRDSDWDELIDELAAAARFPAQLLVGVMPADINEVFSGHNLNLFPVRNSEMLGTCTCPDKARPCKHIAAVHYAFGQALDRDPFLLFELRGADRERLLDGFNRIWFGEDTDGRNADNGALEDRGTPILPLSADRFNRAGAALDTMMFAPFGNPDPRLILERLGAPRSWALPVFIGDLLGPVYEEATRVARAAATAGFELDGDSDSVMFVDSGESRPVEGGFKALALTEGDTAPEPLAGPKPTFALPRSLSVAKKLVQQPPAESDEKPEQSRVLIRKGVAAMSRRRRKKRNSDEGRAEDAPITTTAPTRPPDDYVAPNADDDSSGAPPTTIRRRKAGAAAPPVIRRRGARGIVIEPPAPDKGARGEEQRSAEVRELEERAVRALDDDDSAAYRAALDVFELEPTEARLVLLMQAAHQARREEEVLRSLAARLVQETRNRGYAVDPLDLEILLIGGEYKIAADQIFAMGKKAWNGDDPPAAIFLAFAVEALRTDKETADVNHVAEAWASLTERGNRNDMRDDGDVGYWLGWALQQHPPPPAQHERLLRVCRELAQWLVATRSACSTEDRAARAAVFAGAVAEVLELHEIDGGANSFLASLGPAAERNPLLAAALEAAVAASPVLS